MDVGMALLAKQEGESQDLSLFDFKNYEIGRTTELETILDPGYYIILPRTTGCMLKSQYDSMFKTNPQAEAASYFEDGQNLTIPAKDAFKEVFNMFDSLSRGYLDGDEFF